MRVGVMAYVDGLEVLKLQFPTILRMFEGTAALPAPKPAGDAEAHVHVLYVVVSWAKGQRLPQDATLSQFLATFLRGHSSALSQCGVRRVTFIVAQAQKISQYGAREGEAESRADMVGVPRRTRPRSRSLMHAPPPRQEWPAYFTFRQRLDYGEDSLVYCRRAAAPCVRVS
jgi:hypothetical protein